MIRLFLLLCSSVWAVAWAVDFQTQIRPILEKKCLACHHAARSSGGVQLQTAVSAVKQPWIIPGKPEESRLYQSLNLSAGNPKAMPPGGSLPEAEKKLIKDWIAEGASWPKEITLQFGKKSDENATVAKIRARIVEQSKEKLPSEMKAYTSPIPNTDVKFTMMPIPGGEFLMGTPDSEKGRSADEGPTRKVTVAPFWMARTEVTWDEYRLFMFAQIANETLQPDGVVDAVSRPTKPYVEMSFGMGVEGFPAISMTQHAANKYAQWLSAKTGHFYRLPTEAEWEYACRAGSNTAYSFGEDAAKLSDYAWSDQNADGKYQKVGQKKPNAFGLHDMHGNVMEWTLDQYQPNYNGLPNDNPWNLATKAYPHSVRGGSWNDPADQLRCGARVASEAAWKMQDPNLPRSIWYHTEGLWLGFRLVRPLKVPSVMEMFRAWNNGVERE
jgi:formylglycine-generating enzyme required for sulfatase activity